MVQVTICAKPHKQDSLPWSARRDSSVTCHLFSLNTASAHASSFHSSAVREEAMGYLHTINCLMGSMKILRGRSGVAGLPTWRTQRRGRMGTGNTMSHHLVPFLLVGRVVMEERPPMGGVCVPE